MKKLTLLSLAAVMTMGLTATVQASISKEDSQTLKLYAHNNIGPASVNSTYGAPSQFNVVLETPTVAAAPVAVTAPCAVAAAPCAQPCRVECPCTPVCCPSWDGLLSNLTICYKAPCSTPCSPCGN